MYRIVLLQVWRFQQGDNGRGVGGSTHPRPCLQTLIFEWKSALYFNLWAKVQTFRHLTSAPVLLGQFSHCFFSEPLNTSGIRKMTWLHTSRNPPPPFGTVFPHLYTLLTVSLVLARSSRLICSQDICSRPAVRASDTITRSFTRYKFVTCLLTYCIRRLRVRGARDPVASASRVTFFTVFPLQSSKHVRFWLMLHQSQHVIECRPQETFQVPALNRVNAFTCRF